MIEGVPAERRPGFIGPECCDAVRRVVSRAEYAATRPEIRTV